MLRFGGETCAETGYPRTPTPADLDALVRPPQELLELIDRM
jgi:hypothetical protein